MAAAVSSKEPNTPAATYATPVQQHTVDFLCLIQRHLLGIHLLPLLQGLAAHVLYLPQFLSFDDTIVGEVEPAQQEPVELLGP